MTVLIYVAIFWSGILVGFMLKAWLNGRFREYGGTIVVGTDEIREKTVYSLILDDYPEKLEFKKEVVFKVDTSAKSSDRK
jgi:hypothetical protein